METYRCVVVPCWQPAPPCWLRPHIGRAADAKTLKFIPESDATIVDPIWTTATVTRNHGYLVFDTLYGQNDAFAMEPQMVEGHTVENDGKLWRLTLREGPALPRWRAGAGARCGAEHQAVCSTRCVRPGADGHDG